MVAQRALGIPLAVARLLVGLAVEERHQQELLVVREADVARIGHNRVHVAIHLAVVVNQHVAQQVRLGVLTPDANRHVVDAVEEEAVLELDGLLLLADVVEDAVHLLVGVGDQVVAHEEAAHGDDAHHHQQRPHDARQRHAGRLHGQQLVVLAQVAHRHNGGQQRGQRQTQRNHVGHGVGHQFDDDACAEALAHQLVDVTPYEVHHQDEHHDEEGHNHRSEVGLQYEFVDGFHATLPQSFAGGR